MFTISTHNNDKLIQLENIVITTKQSRPSKSLIDCELYTKYSQLNLELEIFDEYSDFQLKSSDKYHFALIDILNIYRLETIDDTISFNTINIYEITNNSLIVCFEKVPTMYNTCYNLSLIMKELLIGDSILINFTNLFTFPSIELLLLIKSLFSKLKVYYCKILKQIIIYGKNCNSLINSDIFENICSKWSKNCNVRQFGIFIESSILIQIKKFNDYIFSYYLDLSLKLHSLNINDKEYFLKHYIKKQSHKCTLIKDCDHSLKICNLLDCFICIKCADLFMIHA